MPVTARAGIRPGRMGPLLDRRIVLGSHGRQVEKLQVAAEFLAELGMGQAEFDGRLQVAQFAAAVIALAGKAMRIDRFLARQRRDAVGELDLAPGALADLLQVLEDRRRQHVTADDRQVRWSHCRLRLLYDTVYAAGGRLVRLHIDNAVLLGIRIRYELYPEYARPLRVVHLGHLL